MKQCSFRRARFGLVSWFLGVLHQRSTTACGARMQRDTSMLRRCRALDLVTTAAANGSVAHTPLESGESSLSGCCRLLRQTRAFGLVGHKSRLWALLERPTFAALERATLGIGSLLFCLDVLFAIHMLRLV